MFQAVQTVYVVISDYGLWVYNNRDEAQRHIDALGGERIKTPSSTSTTPTEYTARLMLMRVRSKYRGR